MLLKSVAILIAAAMSLMNVNVMLAVGHQLLIRWEYCILLSVCKES